MCAVIFKPLPKVSNRPLGENSPNLELIFCTFFPAENHFPRKIPWHFSEKQFFKTFSAENSLFPNIFWGKIFLGIFPKIFPGKSVRKIGPCGHPVADEPFRSPQSDF
jgi:hypothetical protein